MMFAPRLVFTLLLALLCSETSGLNLNLRKAGGDRGPYGNTANTGGPSASENKPSILFADDLNRHFHFDVIPFAAQSDGTVVAGQPFMYYAYEYYGGGRAYIFDKSSGASQTVEAPEQLSGAQFATAVAIGGDIVAVGSYGSDAVLIYNVHDGKQLGLAHCPGRRQTDEEGDISRQRRIAVDGGAKHLIVVGAQDNGLAYVLDATGAEVAKLQAGDPDVVGFGAAVSADEGIIVVGANGGAGAAYIFDEDFALVKKVEQPSPKESARPPRFGFAVDVDQAADTIVVGAPGADAAYIFDTAGALKKDYELLPEAPAVGDEESNEFGFAVAAANGVIAVGAPHEVALQGNVYLFDAGGKQIGSKLGSLRPRGGDQYGWSVQIGSTPPTILGGEAVDQPAAGSGFVAIGSVISGSIEIHTF